MQSIRVAQNLSEKGYKKGDVLSVATRYVQELIALVIGAWTIGVSINGIKLGATSRKK